MKPFLLLNTIFHFHDTKFSLLLFSPLTIPFHCLLLDYCAYPDHPNFLQVFGCSMLFPISGLWINWSVWKGLFLLYLGNSYLCFRSQLNWFPQNGLHQHHPKSYIPITIPKLNLSNTLIQAYLFPLKCREAKKTTTKLSLYPSWFFDPIIKLT